MAKCLQDAFHQLGALSEKEGDIQQAELYSFLAKTADSAGNGQTNTVWSLREVSRSNAVLARASGLALLLSGAVLLICVGFLVVRRRSLRLAALQPSRMTLTFSFAGAVTALFSSILLYISYRPYAEIARRFIHTGDNTGLVGLSEFLGYTRKCCVDPLKTTRVTAKVAHSSDMSGKNSSPSGAPPPTPRFSVLHRPSFELECVPIASC